MLLYVGLSYSLYSFPAQSSVASAKCHTSKGPYHMSKEPYYKPKEPYYKPKEPYYKPKEPYYKPKEPYYKPKEPYPMSNEPYDTSKKPCHMSSFASLAICSRPTQCRRCQTSHVKKAVEYVKRAIRAVSYV